MFRFELIDLVGRLGENGGGIEGVLLSELGFDLLDDGGKVGNVLVCVSRLFSLLLLAPRQRYVQTPWSSTPPSAEACAGSCTELLCECGIRARKPPWAKDA